MLLQVANSRGACQQQRLENDGSKDIVVKVICVPYEDAQRVVCVRCISWGGVGGLAGEIEAGVGFWEHGAQ